MLQKLLQCKALRLQPFGDVSNDELAILGKYGASKVLTVSNDRLKQFVNMAYGAVVAEAAKSVQANVVVLSSSFSGKGLAPRIAVKLEAGLVDGAIALPDLSAGFKGQENSLFGQSFRRCRSDLASESHSFNSEFL